MACTESQNKSIGSSKATSRGMPLAPLLVGCALASACCAGGSQPSEAIDEAHNRTFLALETQLSNRTPLSAHERFVQARSVLRRQTWEEVEEIHQKSLEAVWRVALRSSPQRILSGIRHVGKALYGLRKRDETEDIALAWLEPRAGEILSDSESDPGMRSVHALREKLRHRELHSLAERQRVRARKLMQEGRFVQARYALDDAIRLEPEAETRNEAVTEEFEENQREARLAEPVLALRSWDQVAAESLLAHSFHEVLTAGEAGEPEAAFTRASAALLLKRRADARNQLASLSERDDLVGDMATRWLERPEVDVQGEFDRAVSAYRWKRLLGWIGGNALAERATSVSVWKDSLTLANMGVSLPARILRGWRPDPSAVQGAAVQYLEREPLGPSAGDARAWLDQLGWPEADEPAALSELARRGPRSRSQALGPLPVVISRGVILLDHASHSAALVSALEGSDAVRLHARPVLRPQSIEDSLSQPGFPVPYEPSRQLLDTLAVGIERGRLHWNGATRDTALEQLRRLDQVLDQGWVLFAESWNSPDSSFWGSFQATLIDGTQTSGRVSLERGEDDLVAVHDFSSEISVCPEATLCIERETPFRTVGFGYLDASAGVGIGFQSVSRWIGTAFAMTDRGPEIQLVLPLARWFGFEEWMPLEAQAIIGAEPYLGPALRKQKCIEGGTPSARRTSARKLLPLGLRSRCVLRLY